MVPKALVYGFIPCLLVLSGCRRSHEACPVAHHAQYGTCVLLDEKRLTDVSLPVGVQAYDISSRASENDKSNDEVKTKYSLATTFESSLALPMLVEFYQNDMERLGWKSVATIPLKSGSFLSYETPRKLCSLFIEDRGSARDVTIFVAART